MAAWDWAAGNSERGKDPSEETTAGTRADTGRASAPGAGVLRAAWGVTSEVEGGGVEGERLSEMATVLGMTNSRCWHTLHPSGDVLRGQSTEGGEQEDARPVPRRAAGVESPHREREVGERQGKAEGREKGKPGEGGISVADGTKCSPRKGECLQHWASRAGLSRSPPGGGEGPTLLGEGQGSYRRRSADSRRKSPLRNQQCSQELVNAQRQRENFLFASFSFLSFYIFPLSFFLRYKIPNHERES